MKNKETMYVLTTNNGTQLIANYQDCVCAFTKEQAKEHIKALQLENCSMLKADEVFNSYKSYDGELINLYKIAQDVMRIAKIDIIIQIGGNKIEEPKEEKIKQSINEVLTYWGINPSDIKEDDFNLLTEMFLIQQNIYLKANSEKAI
jgi:hypothetical protein